MIAGSCHIRTLYMPQNFNILVGERIKYFFAVHIIVGCEGMYAGHHTCTFCATVWLHSGREQKLFVTLTVRYRNILLQCVHSDYFMFRFGSQFQIQQSVVIICYTMLCHNTWLCVMYCQTITYTLYNGKVLCAAVAVMWTKQTVILNLCHLTSTK